MRGRVPDDYTQPAVRDARAGDARVKGALALVLSSLLLFGACSDNGDTGISPSTITRLTLEDLIASVSLGGTQGVRLDGRVDPGGGPGVTVAGNQTVINGGTLSVTVSAATAFRTVYVSVGVDALGIESSARAGVPGYYEVALPAPQTSVTVLLAFPQTIPLDEFELRFSVADASGTAGAVAIQPVEVTRVGTGDVQVTLSWDTDADVDLHVIEPGGEETFYGRRQSSTGGELDLDSNAACTVDGVRNENIRWPEGRAPRGTYTVRVDYWSSCGVAATNYTVRINNGGSVQVFSGSFTGAGDQGGAGSGVTVATFERLTGPAPGSGLAGSQVATVRSKEVSHVVAR
jgi:hypothetical protein